MLVWKSFFKVHLFSVILHKFSGMGRILAIDYGRKRVGLAVTDMNQIIATKLATVSASKIWEFLHTYFQNEQVDEVIIGYPVQMNNTASEAVAYINPFIKKFQEKYPGIPIIQVDERFTSKMAFQAMIDGGVKKMARRDKNLVDAISATIMLQSYLEQKRNRK